MQNTPYRPDNAALEKAKAAANSPAGQQLYQLLQKQNPEDLQKITQSASAGDLAAAKQMLTRLMADPQAQELLRKLGK